MDLADRESFPEIVMLVSALDYLLLLCDGYADRPLQ